MGQQIRYCGNCGALLPSSALGGDGGNGEILCPSCGALISASGDIVRQGRMGADPMRLPPGIPDGVSLSALPTRPEPGLANPLTQIVAIRRVPRPLLAVMTLIALALLLIGGSMLLLGNATGRVHLPGLARSGAGDLRPTATLSAAQAGATKAAQTSQPSSPTGSPLAGSPSPASDTPTPGASVTPTSMSDQPILAVEPLTFSHLVCVASSVQFTVTNAGDGTMAWSASVSGIAYKVTPESGMLEGGQQQVVTVSGISTSGKVTIAATDAANSPQTVNISCGV